MVGTPQLGSTAVWLRDASPDDDHLHNQLNHHHRAEPVQHVLPHQHSPQIHGRV